MSCSVELSMKRVYNLRARSDQSFFYTFRKLRMLKENG